MELIQCACLQSSPFIHVPVIIICEIRAVLPGINLPYLHVIAYLRHVILLLKVLKNGGDGKTVIFAFSPSINIVR
jgi:hypothetical protein